jgi:hypothetical protein
MLTATILVGKFLVERMSASILEGGRALRVFGRPVDGIGLTLQELLMLALVALAADGMAQWFTGRRITVLLVGIVITVLGSFPLLALLGAPPSLGLVIENVVVIPMCACAMLLTVLCLGIRTHRIQRFSQHSAAQRVSGAYVGAV